MHTRGGAGGCWLELAGNFCSLCVCMQQRMDAAIKRSLSLIIVWLGVGLVYQQRTAQVDNCR